GRDLGVPGVGGEPDVIADRHERWFVELNRAVDAVVGGSVGGVRVVLEAGGRGPRRPSGGTRKAAVVERDRDRAVRSRAGVRLEGVGVLVGIVVVAGEGCRPARTAVE